MKVGKPKSKRVPVRLRHKIQKSSAAKQRKARKDAKKNPEWRSRLKKDPGIPNLFPYKDKVLAEIEEGRRRKAEEAQRRKDIAKAQREGKAEVAAAAQEEDDDEDADEELLDREDLSDDEEDDEDEEMDENESSNPMAALLASAQARAQAYQREDDQPASASAARDDEWDGLDDGAAGGKVTSSKTQQQQQQPERRKLPKQALADPIKAVSTLLDRLQKTPTGVQPVMEFYQLPPLAGSSSSSSNSDATARFLVEVARKRGRLGRGGVPNLHSAALTVLGDVNDERLKLPALATTTKSATVTTSSTATKSTVQIVSQLAEPFRIEGLFGDEPA